MGLVVRKPKLIRLLRAFGCSAGNNSIGNCVFVAAAAIAGGSGRGFANRGGGGGGGYSYSRGRIVKANDKNNDDDADADASHVMRDSYRETSGNQYSAHLGCQDMLLGCAERLRRRGSGRTSPPSHWTIADLGSADGSNSIRTVRAFLDALLLPPNGKDRRDGDTPDNNPASTNDNDGEAVADGEDFSNKANVRIVFEEHPSSDESKLTNTVDSWWKNTRASLKKAGTNITCDVLMKSFYEPLFEADSINFCMSYICLHWLDGADGAEEIRSWKRMGIETGDRSPRSDGFLQVNERTAPPELKALWKEELADPHLARFLALRARELKPGAEMLVVMVSDPHEYWKPERSRESPLLRAMKKCVDGGSLRRGVLERAVIPYYLRRPRDVWDALVLAKRREATERGEAPIHSLELVDIRQYETLTGGIDIGSGDGDGMKGARDLFWAIHAGAIANTGGATESEVAAIKKCLAETFDDSYDPTTGVVKGTFIACVFRKA